MIKKLGLLSLVTTVLMANGYKIPEQSVNSVALAGADIANVHTADAAYSNPANMAFMEDGQHMEGSLMYIHLTAVDYEGTATNALGQTGSASSTSKKENFILPTLHYVSEAYGDFRFGASLTVPAGLSKRWQDGGASQLIAEEFTLKVIELNPVVSYKMTETLAVAAGVRMVYSEGVVKSSGTTAVGIVPVGTPGIGGQAIYQTIDRDMKGDSLEFGYNLAVAYKPMKKLSLAVTYRSEVDLKEDGTAKLSASQGFLANGTPIVSVPAANYDGSASVTIPLPATLALAGAYTFNEATTVELVYERTYWSSYELLDFQGYSPALSGVLKAAYDDPKQRNWSDTNTYRFGVTHKFNQKWTGMAGYAFDESPAPQNTVSFELPDSDAQIFSLGARYAHSEELSIGIAGLYDKRESITISQTSATSSTPLNGTFSNASAYLISIGVGYKF